MVRLMPLPSRSSPASFKSRLVLPFWCWLTQVVLEKRPLNGCSSSSSKKYKLFLMGNEAKTDGVGIFVAEKWADSVVRVERHSERIMVLKMVLGNRLLNVFSVYAPHSG